MFFRLQVDLPPPLFLDEADMVFVFAIFLSFFCWPPPGNFSANTLV